MKACTTLSVPYTSFVRRAATKVDNRLTGVSNPMGHNISLESLTVLLLALPCLYFVTHKYFSREKLPTVNRTFPLEPSVFARFRWAFNSQKILDDAYKRVKLTTESMLTH